MGRHCRRLSLFLLPLITACTVDDGRTKKRRNRDKAVDCVMPMVDRPDGIVFDTLSSGSNMSCGVTPASELLCWGSRLPGGGRNLGTIYDSCPSVEKQYQSVHMGENYHCALTTDGLAECWYDDPPGSFAPPVVPETEVFTSISVLRDAWAVGACGLKPSGDVQCWGRAEWIPAALPESAFPVQQLALPSDLNFGHVCVIQADSSVYCFDEYGPFEDDGRDFPVGFFDGPASKVVARGSSVCIQSESGRLDCQTEGYTDEALISYSQGTWLDFDLGGCGTCPPLVCKQTSVGEIQCDGWLNYGALDAPLGTYSMFDVGFGHICALDERGLAVCWGMDSSGQCSGVPTDNYASYD